MRVYHRWLIVGGLFLAVVVVAAWKWPSGSSKLPVPERSEQGYLVWTVEHLKAGLAHKDFTFINVHIPFEGRISGTDLEIPYDLIDTAVERLPKEKGAKIVLYCRSGRMSDLAARRLVELGFTNVASVKGGMLAWAEAGGKINDK